jgi:predicted phage terminase large subunit-like protein
MRRGINLEDATPDALARLFRKEQVIDTAAELQRLACERSLADYVREAWPILNPATPLVSNWHIDLICEYLHACSLGQIHRLIINVPPKATKSTIVSVLWPTWWWGPQKHPQSRWMFASYSEKVSTRDSLNRRSIIQSDWYQSLWSSRVRLIATPNQRTFFQNSVHGQMLATTMSGQGTGLGGGYLVIDDPHDTEQVESEKERKRALHNFDHKLYTRLDDRITGVIVIIMQRLHTMDLTGHLLQGLGGARWEHICIPMEAPARRVYSFPLSNKQYVREEGALLNPKREGATELAEHKERLGTLGYAAQFQQQPVPEGGAIFKLSYFKLWPLEKDRDVELPHFTRKVQSWDTAIKAGESDSHTVGTTWGEFDGGYILLDVMRKRLEFPEMIHAMCDLAARWHPDTILVEDKSSGQSAIQELRRTTLPVIPIRVDSDKIARARAAAPTAEAGKIWIMRNAEWARLYLDEMCNFPKSEFSDQVDSTSQFINWVRQQSDWWGASLEYDDDEDRQRGIAQGRRVWSRQQPDTKVWACAYPGCGREMPNEVHVFEIRGVKYCSQEHARAGQ